MSHEFCLWVAKGGIARAPGGFPVAELLAANRFATWPSDVMLAQSFALLHADFQAKERLLLVYSSP